MVCSMWFFHVELESRECGKDSVARFAYDMFSQAKVFTSGDIVLILDDKHTKRSWYANRLKLARLHTLLVVACCEYGQIRWALKNPLNLGKTGRKITDNLLLNYNESLLYLLANCRFVSGRWVDYWTLPLSACDELCNGSSPLDIQTMPIWCIFLFLKGMTRLSDTRPSISNGIIES